MHFTTHIPSTLAGLWPEMGTERLRARRMVGAVRLSKNFAGAALLASLVDACLPQPGEKECVPATSVGARFSNNTEPTHK